MTEKFSYKKDFITDEDFFDLLDDQRKEYESSWKADTETYVYIKKSAYYGHSADIVRDPTCDLDFLQNAVINKIGFHKKAEEGGLAIEYTKNNETKIVVLGFTELGMWVIADVSKIFL